MQYVVPYSQLQVILALPSLSLLLLLPFIYARVVNVSMSQFPPARVEPEVEITNIVAKSLFLQPFSLSQLDGLPLDFSNPFLTRIPLRYRHVKFSILQSGTVIARAAASFDELQEAFDWLRQYALTEFKLELAPYWQVSNIAAVSCVSHFKLDLCRLAPLLPRASYDPSPLLFNAAEHHVNSIVFMFNPEHSQKPHRTALIFHTGKATLTGFFSLYDLRARASQLYSLIAEIAAEHPKVIYSTKLDVD